MGFINAVAWLFVVMFVLATVIGIRHNMKMENNHLFAVQQRLKGAGEKTMPTWQFITGPVAILWLLFG